MSGPERTLSPAPAQDPAAEAPRHHGERGAAGDAAVRAEALVPAFEAGVNTSTIVPLDLVLPPGALVCLLGPSRHDNFSWLRALGGVEPPCLGRLWLLGREIWRLGPREWRTLRAKVGYVGPSAPVLSVVDAVSNVMMPALYHRFGTQESVRGLAEAVLARVGWSVDPSLLPAYLDDHHRRLLALARCLILDPEVVFVDEPFALADPINRKSVERLYASLVERERIGIVVQTQNLGFIRNHAQMILYANHLGLHLYPDWRSFEAEREAFIRHFERR